MSVSLIRISVTLCIICLNVLNISEVSALDQQKTSKTPFVTTIKHIPRNSQEQYHFEQSAVIFCIDLEDIEEFNKKVTLSNKYAKKLKFLVICEKSIDRKFPTPYILKWQTGLIVQFQYFLINKTGKLELSTYEFFKEGKCNQPQLTQFNSFSKTTLKWKKQLTIKDKFMNLNQCEITYAVIPGGNPKFCISKNKMFSFQEDIYKALSKKGNFQRNYVSLKMDKDLKAIAHAEFQLCLAEASYVFSLLAINHITTSHTETILGFMLSPTEQYTSYEKILMPFDDLTWIFLIATFGFSFGFISIIKRYAPWYVQNWIFGEGVTSPAFNLIAMFFGIGQLRVPFENSARIILVSYLFFCLVIRTAYQGVFFEMFTHELRKPQPESIDDLLEQNYTIFITPAADVLMNTIEKSRRPHINNNRDTYDSLIRTIISGKIAMLNHINDKVLVPETFKAGFRGILKERLIAMPLGIRFPRNHFLYHITDEIVQNFLSGGIIDQAVSFTQSVCFTPYIEDEWEPYVFSLDDLMFGFNIWLVTVAASLIVHALELTWFYGKKTIRSIIALYFLLERLERGFDT